MLSHSYLPQDNSPITLQYVSRLHCPCTSTKSLVYLKLALYALRPTQQDGSVVAHCPIENIVMLQQHHFLSQMSPGSPMHGSSSLASAASMFHMSQSSGSPNFSYPYSHWYWPQAPLSPQAAPPLGSFMQTQYAASHTFSSGNQNKHATKVYLSGQLIPCSINLKSDFACPNDCCNSCIV